MKPSTSPSYMALVKFGSVCVSYDHLIPPPPLPLLHTQALTCSSPSLMISAWTPQMHQRSWETSWLAVLPTTASHLPTSPTTVNLLTPTSCEFSPHVLFQAKYLTRWMHDIVGRAWVSARAEHGQLVVCVGVLSECDWTLGHRICDTNVHACTCTTSRERWIRPS